ncbi:hypothetical protein ABFS83_01G069600 [Erythranthe nasuta]
MADEYKRRNADITNLKCAGFEVDMVDNRLQEFSVKFHGPRGTNYEGGVWSVYVFLASNYPVMHPILQFSNKIYHPNISYATGTVCVNVLGQAWKDGQDLKLLFGTFLPQLLKEPNVNRPFNLEAANLMKSDPSAYEQKVRDETEEHAKPAAVNAAAEETAESTD